MAVFINQKDGALNDFKVNHAPGAVFQAGLDWMIGGNWGINVDVKKYILRTTATGLLLGAAPVRSEIISDPWLVGAGLAYRF
jgi:outer membrane protein